MKKKLVISAIALVIIFVLAYRFSNKSAITVQPPVKAPQDVTVQAVKDSIDLKQTLDYPATVVGDQEIIVTATAAGTASAVPFNLGDRVFTGALLTRIDDTGNVLNTNYKDFQSSQIQESHLSKEQAEEALSGAEKNYKDLKKAYSDQNNDPTLTKTVSKAQVDAAKNQIDIAELQLKSATVGLKGTLDNHLVTSPISGFVTEKFVSAGDSISIGQKVAAVSVTKNIKLQFFVSADHLANFSLGTEIKAIGNNGNIFPMLVRNISPVADPATKRFLIEAFPKTPTATPVLASGTLTTVSLDIVSHPSASGDLILPLSAVTIGQNESYLFINDNGHAKKIFVTIGAVNGESAEIKTSLPSDAEIILNGSKLVSDGLAISIQK